MNTSKGYAEGLITQADRPAAVVSNVSRLDVKTPYSQELASLLSDSLEQRPADAILLSGGIDSSMLAALDTTPLAITVGFAGDSEDLKASRRVAEHLGMRWHRIAASMNDMRSAVRRLVSGTATYNPGLFHDIPLLIAMEHAAEEGCASVRTGEIADLLFGGYSSAWHLENYADGLRLALPKVRLTTVRVGSLVGRRVHEPYFDQPIQDFALRLPPEEMFASVQTREYGDKYLELNAPASEDAVTERIWGKIVLRRAALGLLPLDIAFRQKQDAGYGSGSYLVEQALGDDMSDDEFLEMCRDVHPFYTKAHAALRKIYDEVVPSSPSADVVCPCAWCGRDLGSVQHHCLVCGAYDANLQGVQEGHTIEPFLVALREAIPLLRDLPQSILAELNPGEFAMPTPEVEEIRSRLERETGCYVMTYKTGVFLPDIPARAHLCNWLKQAVLSPKQEALLRESEDVSEPLGVSFVLYQKPLGVMPPSGNPIAQAYIRSQQARTSKKD